MYKMKDVTQLLNMTVYTVRHYTDSGLVPNVKRDENGNRLFDETALNWLKAAQFLRGCGLSVAEVHHYFTLCQRGPATIQERAAIIQAAQAATTRRLAALQQQVAVLDDRAQHYQAIIAGTTQDDSNPEDWDPRKLC
ncbi:hypothetical protein LAC03_01900 [Levilactobacillus acidifarinae]|nr:hypothetical protein LAC03_01900 [Levilactobacillus acidifarinae]